MLNIDFSNLEYCDMYGFIDDDNEDPLYADLPVNYDRSVMIEKRKFFKCINQETLDCYISDSDDWTLI